MYADRVKETTATTGTGTLSLDGAASGHQGVVAAIGNGNSAYFCAENGTDWEVFEGTVTDGAPDTLSRDTILASSNAGAAVNWGAGAKNVFLVVPASKVTDLDTRLKTISSNLTLYVSTTGNDTTGDGSSGSPWATPHKALEYLGDYFWNMNTTTVTIQCGDGTYTLTSPLTPKHLCGAGLKITGEHTYTKSMTSVQSSSGSAGAWSIVINLDSVTNIAANDYVIISGASGGTKPTFICGCHKVTALDGVNNRITVTSTHRHSTAPSGAVTATVTVFKTMLDFSGYSGLVLTNQAVLGDLDKIVLVGNSTASTYGISTSVGAGLISAGYFGISGFERGIQADTGARLMATNYGVSGASQHGVMIINGAIFKATTIQIVSGNGTSTSYAGYYLVGNSQYHNGNVSTNIITGNAGNGVQCYPGAPVGIFNYAVVTGNGSYGFIAGNYGYIQAAGATLSDNVAGTYSPAVNTQGNEYGYIDT